MPTLQPGSTSQAFDVDIGQTVSVTPGSGGTMLVEYTTNSETDIRNGSANWQAWTAGTVSTATSDVAMFPMFARVTAYTAVGSYELSGSGLRAVPNQYLAWKSDVVSARNPVSAAAVVGAAGGYPAVCVLNDLSAATANTSTIQAALTYGGTVSLIQPGTIWINDTLIYDSDTQIVLGPKTCIKMVAGIRKPLLRSRAYYRMRDTPVPVTITWASGMTFSVSWTGHGKIKGDAIWINGATLQAQFKGVFVIETVTDANNVVVRANRLPAGAPTGDVFAVAATQHVTITGGTWDYNYDGTFATGELDRNGVYNWGVYNVWMRNVRVASCAKYNYCWLAHKDCGFDQAGTTQTNSDICKIYGPGVHFRGRGIFGECGDDACSIQTREPPAFAAYQPYWGDVIDCSVEDIDAVSSTSLAVFYPHAIADGIIDRCGYDGISGRAPKGVRTFANSAERAVGYVWARNIQADCTYPAKLDIFQCHRIDVQIAATTSGTSTANQILAASGFNSLLCNFEPYLISGSFASSSAYAISYSGSANLLRVSLGQTLVASAANARALNLEAVSTVLHAVIDGYEGNADTLVENNATNTPTISVINSRLGGAAVLSARASCNLHMAGNDITNASNGVVRFNATATVNLRTDGTNRLRAGSWSAAPAGTPTLNMYGWDISVDPISVVGATSTVGQYCNSTQAGTEGGPAVRTPAGWVALGTGASGVNTVIT